MSIDTIRRIPAAALPQLFSDGLHLLGAIVVAICVTVLTYAGKLPPDITGAVYTGVIGYIAGRAGPVPRTAATRASDPIPHDERGA